MVQLALMPLAVVGVARLAADNVDLRSQILTLKYQVQSLQAANLTPTPASTPVGPFSDGGVDRQLAP